MNVAYIAPLSPEVTKGVVFYTDTGFQIAFMIGAAATTLGVVVAFTLPRSIERLRKPTESNPNRSDVVATN